MDSKRRDRQRGVRALRAIQPRTSYCAGSGNLQLCRRCSRVTRVDPRALVGVTWENRIEGKQIGRHNKFSVQKSHLRSNRIFE